jgi:hypothetical protein
MAARKAQLMLADSRALEEEAERVNPVNPIRKTARKGYTGIVRDPIAGAGATPSMGLSQVRGGAMPPARIVGAAACGAGEEMETDGEAEMMGAALSKHIKELHGGAFHSKFMKGMGVSGGAQMPVKPFVVTQKSGAYEGKGKSGAGPLEIEIKHDEMKGAGAADKRKSRGAMVSKLMREKKMSLGEASKYLKAHPQGI